MVLCCCFSYFSWYCSSSFKIQSSTCFIGCNWIICLFITDGFKKNAEENEKKLIDNTSEMSDISKILYLEIIDTTFSIDGVLGAFAFTMSIPLIILGNGIGAIVVRKITMGSIEKIKKYIYLKNGAMYSVLCLGIVMVLEGFHVEVPEYISPLLTILIIMFFFFKSKIYAEKNLS
ncbi:DUF475 domain-containing protein [Clostridium ljungdahlii]|uniref:DUF475 domain-containing protein n=1 Tax=Clostridium ljungdahlii TaxID=1538 RepID=UPI00386BD734